MVEIRYYNLENGKVIYTQKLQNIEAKKGKLNLVSSSSTMDEFKQTDFKNNTVSSETDNYDVLPKVNLDFFIKANKVV